MDLSVFFDPIESQVLEHSCKNVSNSFYHQIDKHSDKFPDLQSTNIVILAIDDNRGSVTAQDCVESSLYIRQKLYALKSPTEKLKIADLGNLKIGATVEMTYQRMKEVISFLIKNKLIVIIIGGSHDLTLGQYYAFQELEQLITVLISDSTFDLETEDSLGLNKCHINRLLLHDPNFLFHFIHLGNQSYLVDSRETDTFEKLHYDIIRIGELKKDIEIAEPYIRYSDMMSIDISSNLPFGFNGEENCQLAWYAGLNEKLRSFGIYEYNPSTDPNKITANLIATMIWYFIHGSQFRKNEMDFSSNQFQKFIVPFKGEPSQIVFYKSTLTEKWWMEVPCSDQKNKYRRSSFVPCSYQDYQYCLGGQIPDRWLKTSAKYY